MRALGTLNHYFWKYRYRLGLGFLFILLTNVFAVYAPRIVEEGIGVLARANERYFDAEGASADEIVRNQAGEELFDGEDLSLPQSLVWIGDVFGIRPSATENIRSFDQLAEALIQVAVLLAILYIVLYFIKGVFLFATRQTIIVMSRLIEFDQKNEIYAHYQKLNMAFYKRNNTGDLMNRISEDVAKVRMYFGPAVMYTLNLLVLVVMVVSIMFYIDVELSLYALSPLPFMSVGIYYVSNMINKRSERVQRQQSNLSTMVQDSISGVRVIKAYNRETHREKVFDDASDIYKMRALDLVKVDALFMPIIVLLVGLSTVLTIYIGGQKVMAGELQIEQIFTFVIYVNLLTWPFASVGWVTSLVQKAEASQQRINEFLSVTPEVVDGEHQAQEIKGNIVFKDVHFTYPDSGVKALRGVSFEIKAGETLAVIGKTGSGKSTLANLLVRHYDPTSGAIQLDGRDLKNYKLGALRDHLGYVPQEVFLFSESISENIAFGINDASQERIEQAAKDACVHENIVDFPKGYNTRLGERGLNLSGGQKQRISIARAIVRDPAILIFDDCLSAVDTQTEESILSRLRVLMKGKTSILISHRVSTVKQADKILVIDQGKVIEEGTHAELLELGGAYASLHEKQQLESQVG